MKKFALALLSMLVLGHIAPVAADPAATDDHGWLVGKWELTLDPDGGKTDWLEFGRDGKAASITSDGRRIPGEYVVTAGKVQVVYSYQGKSIPITLSHTPDRKKLLLYSERTHNTSEYQKLN